MIFNVKMPKRYFVNGFVGKESLHEVIDKTFVTGRIKEVVDQIIARQKLGRRDLGRCIIK